jgi:hypothetical protein
VICASSGPERVNGTLHASKSPVHRGFVRLPHVVYEQVSTAKYRGISRPPNGEGPKPRRSLPKDEEQKHPNDQDQHSRRADREKSIT